MPHLNSFRRDGAGFYFCLRKDEGYWDAVKQLGTRFGSSAKYVQSTHEFRVPNTPRSQIHLAAIFPEEWEIIQATNTHKISFTETNSHRGGIT